jgi:NADH-quinone oxidoreductase subunit J
LILADAVVAQNIFFGLIAAGTVFGALRVVTTKNVVHAALYLVVVLAGVAGLFVMTLAEFTAATQVLVYIGAIVVLFLFGIMLTRSPIGRDGDLTHKHWVTSAATALLLFGVMAYTLIDEFGWTRTPLPADTRVMGVDGSNTATVSDAVFNQYLVPFEAVSVLLLAALVGAIVLARKD